ncbi:MAG: preprotein translocase subunit SecG [Candidatus Omnitrophica bacterium]|nr:preprotein translocase subunit SecG [Candidatus Omnitrophota bacterium]
MTGVITFIHVIACALLITIILMQSGRGGGLTEAFASAESFFGAKTNEFLVKGTTIIGIIFLITCMSLAYFSSKRDQSLMSSIAALQKKQQKAEEQQPVAATKTQAATPVAAPAKAQPAPVAATQAEPKKDAATKPAK